jgi:hypothetical protein
MLKKNFKKFGGMISENSDQFSKINLVLKKNDLTFSHGRSAIIWLIKNNSFKHCLMCNYTWPAIPELMKTLHLKFSFYDLFEQDKDIEKRIKKIDGKILLIVSVFYGFKTWINYSKIEKNFKDKVYILIDGAQTAYAFKKYDIPKNGAILSCPHKSLDINDGAVLRMSKLSSKQRESYKQLEIENSFYKYKKKSRKLINSGNLNLELKGLKISKKLEETWKSFPEKKMSKNSLIKFIKIDEKHHEKKRLRNFNYLKKKLIKYNFFPKYLRGGCPFGFPILTKKRDKLIKMLHQERIYATPLWNKNKYVKKKFKNSYKYKNHFLSLPIDQRYNLNDLEIMSLRFKKAFEKI